VGGLDMSVKGDWDRTTDRKRWVENYERIKWHEDKTRQGKDKKSRREEGEKESETWSEAKRATVCWVAN